MAPRELRVLARGDLLVLDYAHAQSTGAPRYIGRDTVLLTPDNAIPDGVPWRQTDPEFYDGIEQPTFFYPKRSTPSVFAMGTNDFDSVQYVAARVREGGLWAYDQATADACGVSFDPTFGEQE